MADREPHCPDKSEGSKYLKTKGVKTIKIYYKIKTIRKEKVRYNKIKMKKKDILQKLNNNII